MIDDLRSPLLIELQSYWNGKRGGRRMPARRDLDPTEIAPALLPRVKLLDVEAESGRLRIRLIGTRFAADYGRDTTGCYLDDLEERLHAGLHLSDFYNTVSSQRRPRRRSGWFQKANGQIMGFECLALPLSTDGRTVDMIFCGLDATPLK